MDSLYFCGDTNFKLSIFIKNPAAIPTGCPLATVLGATAEAQIEQLIAKARSRKTAVGLLSIAHPYARMDVLAHVYTSDQFFVLELEYGEVVDIDERLAILLLQMERAILEPESDGCPVNYFDELARMVRQLTGYDSVMVYQFATDWSGEVIAESLGEKVSSYLGLHFPASDIPLQARVLYTKNSVRIVADIDSTPVPVSPALRSLSLIHVEYLRNIGVRASMSISLLQNGRLWGLVVCHHLSPSVAPGWD